MYPRNLMFAVLVAVFGWMTVSCLTSNGADTTVAQTQLPLEMNARTAAVQAVVTTLAVKAKMAVEVENFIASN